jgi:ribose transport system ATP-binding protein
MVTHRLAEVQDVCDRVLVLRDGQLVHEAGKGEMAPRDLIHHMVWRPGAHRVSSAEVRHEAIASATPVAQTQGEAALELVNLVGSGLKASTLRLRPGEIVGVVGRRDGGARALLRLVSGIDTPISGHVFVDGVRLPSVRHPRFALRHGITYLSSDRDIEGGIASMSVRENLTLPTAGRYWRRRSAERRDAREMIDLLDIRPADLNALFGRLSGGNQQKVLLGRWLLMPPRVLVLDDPTSGVDPTTRERIFETLRRLSDAGVAILFGSTEPEQLVRLCSRVLVMRDGVIAEELSGPNLETETISLASLE